MSTAVTNSIALLLIPILFYYYDPNFPILSTIRALFCHYGTWLLLMGLFQNIISFFFKKKFKKAEYHSYPATYIEEYKIRRVFALAVLIPSSSIYFYLKHIGSDYSLVIWWSGAIALIFALYLLLLFPIFHQSTELTDVWILQDKTIFYMANNRLFEIENSKIEKVSHDEKNIIIEYLENGKTEETTFQTSFFERDELNLLIAKIQSQ